ncbi:MAG: family 20 glycosylhydrolase [Candidatus Thioglobus sp.]|nr:family 20 glycosylhydrolase [Candidatus Thioglobus sp.]
MSLTEFVMTTEIDSNGFFCSKLKNNSGHQIDNFSFCFSLLSPVKAYENCIVSESVGGYSELSNPSQLTLNSGEEWNFKYGYEFDRHKPLNHTWGPQGGFLKLQNGNTINIDMTDLDLQRISSVASTLQVLGNNIPSESLRLVPQPYIWKPSAGVCNLSESLNVVLDESEMITNAYKAASELGKRINIDALPLKINQQSQNTATSLRLKFEKFADTSSYNLTITSDAIELTAGDESGFFYGLISLLQLHQTYHKLIPCGLINDKPRFSWRGQHLDTVRHFYSVNSLLKLLDLMSLFKLNKFHWHGTDDEAFRFKLDSNPELATATAKRGNNLLVPPIFGSGANPTGGCYDSIDIQKVTERAALNYIDVMPEFDLPGHNMALINLLSSVRDPHDKSNEVSVQGYRENTLNPAMPFTFSLVESLIDDLCKIFPGEYIHLGGDEVASESWSKSPAIETLKLKHNLKNNKDVASWFINKLSARVKSNNKKIAAWQEAEEGDHEDEQTEKLLFSWQNLESGYKLARDGFKVVLCPAEHIYFDMAQSKNYSDRGIHWAAIIALEDTVNWQVIPSDEPELEKNIKGIQGHLWSETIIKDSDMDAMLCPRIIGLAESAWSTEANKRKGSELSSLILSSFRNLFNQIGWSCYQGENFDIMSDPLTNKEALASE